MTYFACGKSHKRLESKLSIPFDQWETESPKAYGFRINGQLIWLPKSQVKDWERDEMRITFWLPTWLIEKNSLEVFLDTSDEPSLFETK